MRQAGLLRLQGGHLRGSRLFGEEVAGQEGHADGEWDHQPPDGDTQGGVNGGKREGPAAQSLVEEIQRATLHSGGAACIKDQRQPGANQALGRAVPGTGGAAAGEHDARTEEEAAEGHGQRGEFLVIRGDDPGGGQRRQTHGVDGDDDKEGGESAPRLVEEDIADHAGDAESATLHDPSEYHAEREAGDDHVSLFSVSNEPICLYMTENLSTPPEVCKEQNIPLCLLCAQKRASVQLNGHTPAPIRRDRTVYNPAPIPQSPHSLIRFAEFDVAFPSISGIKLCKTHKAVAWHAHGARARGVKLRKTHTALA